MINQTCNVSFFFVQRKKMREFLKKYIKRKNMNKLKKKARRAYVKKRQPCLKIKYNTLNE